MLLQGRRLLKDALGAVAHHSPQLAKRGVQACLPSMNLGAGLVSIGNSELNSKARNPFAGCWGMKTQTVISTPVILESFCGRRAEAEEGRMVNGAAMSWLSAQGRQCTRCVHQ